jgi:hypothetical protein
MPHYSDGTEAKIGDLVVGSGYNVKRPNGSPATIAGTVVDITPGANSCNIKVAFARVKRLDAEFRYPDFDIYTPKGIVTDNNDRSRSSILPAIEYGQADAFRLVK